MLPGTSDLPANRCVRCRRQRRKRGLYCRPCHDAAKARMRAAAQLPWWDWEPYLYLDVREYERRVLTELRRLCEAKKRPPDAKD